MLVLEGVESTWRTAAVRLESPKSEQTGILLDDTLLCLGGVNQKVRLGGGGSFRGGTATGGGVPIQAR